MKKKPETTEEKSVPLVSLIALDEISDSPYDPRHDKTPEADTELVASIQEHGVLQPVLVRILLTGYELIGGHRRVRAARVAGLKEIPAVIRHGVSDSEAAELAIIDNVQRQQISLLDEAFAYKRLRDEFGRSADDIAGRCHRSKTAVYDALRVADLPDDIIALVRDAKLHYSHAVALTGAAGDGERLQDFADQAVRFSYTAKQVESMVASWKEEQAKSQAEQEAREKPPLPLEQTEATEATETAPEEATAGASAPAEAEPVPSPEPAPSEPPAAKSTPAKEAPKPASTPAPTKAPEGMISTFVPKEDCLFCQDAGLTMQEIFALVRRLIELGRPKGLSPDDVLATTEALLNE